MLLFAANAYAAATLTVEAQGDGYVDSYPSGILCGAACVETYDTGIAITLTAHLNEGATFSGWTGCDQPSGTTCTMNLDSDKTVTATFSGEVKSDYNLRVYRTGGLGVVQSDPFGIYCGSICSYDEAKFEAGSTVIVTASAQSGYMFNGWSGDCSGTSPTCTVTMGSSKTVTASFRSGTSSDGSATATPSLTIQKKGEGTVKSGDKKINCGTSCSSAYNPGDSVTLTATTLVAGTTFLGWSGACSGAKNTCIVTIDAAKTVTANFGALTFPLTVSVTGISGGTGSIADSKYINCSIGTCSANISFGTSVTLSPSAGTYSYFSGFGGSCSGNSCTVVINSDKKVSASFTILSYALAVAKSGTGVGEVASSDNIINCGTSCTSKYNHGSSITLTANPDAISTFTGWGGGGCTGIGSCTVTMDSAKTITAAFSRIYRATVEKKGEETGIVKSADGTINCGNVCTATLLEGTEVALEASQSGIFIPDGFEGPCNNNGKDRICTLTMNYDKKVVAKFVPLTQEITVAKTGKGKVESTDAQKQIDCGAKCSAKFREGSIIAFKATPDKGSRFSQWNGGCSGRKSTCDYVVKVAEEGKTKNIGAVFEEAPVLTVVNKYGNVITSSVSQFELDSQGEAAADIAKEKISCGEKSSKQNRQTDCSIEYKASGFFVRLSLKPNSGGAKWIGCSNPLVTDTCDVYIDRSKTVEVTMVPDGERELVKQAIWELYGMKNPSLDSYITTENNPPFKRTLEDLQAGKMGHTIIEIEGWIAQNGQWYLNEGGINRITDEWEKGTAKQVLLEVFAAEIAGYPTLVDSLTDESQKPFQTALVDLKAGRDEGEGKEGLKKWISQPQNRQWYLDATGISTQITAIEQAKLEEEKSAKAPSITSISPDNGKIGGRPLIVGKFYDVQLVTLNDNPVSYTVDFQKSSITINNIRWGTDPYGVEVNVPGIVKVYTNWGTATSKLISPSGPIYKNAVGKEEGCFPGVGSGCDGGGAAVQAILRGMFGKPIGCDVQNDGSLVCSIAAGSIEHDNCCVRFPNGKWCGGPGLDGEGGQDAWELNHDGHCSYEWDHAFWDVMGGNGWNQRYERGQKFDLTPSGGSRNNVYVLGEAVSSLSYCAPSGHVMREADDAPFCCSKKIKYPGWFGWGSDKPRCV